MTRDELTPIFDKIHPLPEVAVRVLGAVDRDDATVDDLADLIRQDPLLDAACLRVANSPLMGVRHTIDSVERAIALLGRRALTKLVITACAGDTLQGGGDGYRLEHCDLFRHGLAAAVASELVTGQLKEANPGLLYSACLLQDIGKIALDAWVAERGMELHELMDDEVPFPEAERLAFGVDHATVGGWLAESWAFPAPLVEAITYHHHPERAADPTVARVVQLCDLLCLMQGIGCGTDGLAYQVPDHLLADLQLTPHAVSAISIDLAARLTEIDALAAESVAP